MAQDDFLTFVERVKQAESRGQRFGKDGKLLTSSAGAQGEMQVMPATQRRPGFGITPVRDDSPDEIARVGRDLLKALDNHYGGNKMYAAAAYNWGKSNVDKWIANGADFNKLPKETQGYLKRIQPETLPSMAKKAPADTPEVGPAVMEPPLGISASAAPAKSAAPAAVAAAPIARPEDLGSGYKAALALSFLGSEDRDRPTTDSELEDRLNETALAEFNKELEDYTPKNALADVEITALNPVKALQSSQPVEPVRMAAGGVPYNPIARVLPSARAQLESIKKDYERYNAAVPQFNAALQKYQTEVYQPYEQAINRYNAEIEAYNAGPREEDFTGTAPTAPAEFSMAAPTAPSVTQAQYDQMAADAKKSAARRQMALVVASDPERFGLSINKFFADGGEVTGPTPEEIAAASRPATFNPQIARQGAAARALAAQRDVNTLPDPRTYAAVSGFLGQAPDELGFSAMHPDIKGITTAGEAGYAAGLAPVVAPVVAPIARAVGKGATALGMKAEKALEGPVSRTLEGGGRSAEMLRALGAQPSYAVRPKGGHFELRTEYNAKGDRVTDDVTKTVGTYLADTPDQPLNNWFNTKYATYLRRDLGAEGDPFVKAADAGKKLHIPNEPLSEDWQRTLNFVRKSEGMPPQGFATTEYGRRVEGALDASLNIRELGELAGNQYFLDRIPPGITRFINTNPEMRIYSLDDIMESGPRAESLRDTMLEMRQPSVSFYGEPIDIPKNYRLTNESLQGLTPVQASEKAALFTEWKDTARQKAATLSVRKNEDISKRDVGDGYLWLNPPDLSVDPKIRQMVQDIGCDGGWCTRDENFAMNYGSGNSRLSILLDNKNRPVAQMTIEDLGPPNPKDFIKSLSPQEIAAFRSNPLYRNIQDDELHLFADSFPQYDEYIKNAPPRLSITEIKSRGNKADVVNTVSSTDLKKIQDQVKDLDARFDLQYVQNLKGIGMTDLTSHIKDALTGLNVTLSKATSSATLKEASRLNGGSSYINNDPQEINRIIVQAYRNITQPPVNRAKGGMVERTYNDNRAYL